MKENNYKRSAFSRPCFKLIRKPLCAVFLVCLLPGVASADLSEATLPSSDSKLPVVSPQAKIDAVVTPSSQEMPAMAGETIEIAEKPEGVPDVGASTSLESDQTKAADQEEGSPTQDKSPQPYLMSASLTPASYGMPGQEPKAMRVKQVSTREAAGSMSVDNKIDDQLQLPYALALALMAIIGLVPVSRRSH